MEFHTEEELTEKWNGTFNTKERNMFKNEDIVKNIITGEEGEVRFNEDGKAFSVYQRSTAYHY